MKGIQTTPSGFRAYVRVAGHPLKSKRFPVGTTDAVMKLWRERTRAKMLLAKDVRTHKAPSGYFRADAILYLESVTAMPTYKERVKHLFEWIALFDEQETDSITPAQIRGQRDRWLTVGPRTRQRGKLLIVEAKPLSPQSVALRMRALENFFTVLYPGQPNPVRQVPEPEGPEGLPRGLSVAVLEKVFKALPDGKTRARLLVLRWTGLPAKTLMRLSESDVDLKGRVIYLPGRKKGQGTRGGALPLLPEAVKAFKLLKKVKGWGAFSTSGMHSLFQRACQRAKVKGITPYDLRHTFGTNFLLATGDLRATQHALNHSTPKLTERYARAAVSPALKAAYAQVAKVGKAVAADVANRQKRP